MFLSLSSMTPLMWGEMILFMAVFMALLMFVVHVMRMNHLRRHGQSSHGPSGVVSLVNWGIKVLLHLGIRVAILGPMMLLTVRGRKTGKLRTIPVDVHEHDGRRFLIATHGEGNWVRNLRVAGSGVLSLGRHREAFTTVELAPEEAGPLIKEILGPLLASQGIRGNALRQHLGVRADSSVQEFIMVARTHPIFELNASSDGSLYTHEHEASHPHPPDQPSRTGEERPHPPHEGEARAREQDHPHEHTHRLGWLSKTLPFLHGHSHSEMQVGRAMETNARGIWALKVSLTGLFILDGRM